MTALYVWLYSIILSDCTILYCLTVQYCISDCTILYCLTVQYCIVWLYNIVLSDCTILYYLTVRCCFVSLYNIKLCDCTILYYLTVQNDTVWLYNIVGPTAFYSKYSTWCDTGGWLNLHCNFFHISQFSLNNWTQFLLGFPKESEQCLRDVDIVLVLQDPSKHEGRNYAPTMTVCLWYL